MGILRPDFDVIDVRAVMMLFDRRPSVSAGHQVMDLQPLCAVAWLSLGPSRRKPSPFQRNWAFWNHVARTERAKLGRSPTFLPDSGAPPWHQLPRTNASKQGQPGRLCLWASASVLNAGIVAGVSKMVVKCASFRLFFFFFF